MIFCSLRWHHIKTWSHELAMHILYVSNILALIALHLTKRTRMRRWMRCRILRRWRNSSLITLRPGFCSLRRWWSFISSWISSSILVNLIHIFFKLLLPPFIRIMYRQSLWFIWNLRWLVIFKILNIGRIDIWIILYFLRFIDSLLFLFIRRKRTRWPTSNGFACSAVLCAGRA